MMNVASARDAGHSNGLGSGHARHQRTLTAYHADDLEKVRVDNSSTVMEQRVQQCRTKPPLRKWCG